MKKLILSLLLASFSIISAFADAVGGSKCYRFCLSTSANTEIVNVQLVHNSSVQNANSDENINFPYCAHPGSAGNFCEGEFASEMVDPLNNWLSENGLTGNFEYVEGDDTTPPDCRFGYIYLNNTTAVNIKSFVESPNGEGSAEILWDEVDCDTGDNIPDDGGFGTGVTGGYVSIDDSNSNSVGSVPFQSLESRETLENNVNLDNISIYPNPAIDVLTISGLNTSEPVNFQVFNAEGKTFTINKSGINEVNIKNLNSGLYFIRIESNGETKILRFLKKD